MQSFFYYSKKEEPTHYTNKISQLKKNMILFFVGFLDWGFPERVQGAIKSNKFYIVPATTSMILI